MSMPRPREEHRKLHAMVGDWSGAETIFPGPEENGGPAHGRIRARLELDGFFVIADYSEERAGAIVYRGHGVYGWDDAEKCYVMNWFNSVGDSTLVHVNGAWDGDTLRFERRSPARSSRYTYTFEAADRYRFRIETSTDGTVWLPYLEALYVRG